MIPEPARSIARDVAGDLASDGAEAVVLVGSYARGNAGPHSDLDVLAVGEEVPYRPEIRNGLLVAVTARPIGAYRGAFENPQSLGTDVPGWREALVLHDPEGLAASLIHEAKAWSWEPLESRCDVWVAEGITGLAEEVHKLVAALRRGNRSTAAVQRSILAVQLAPILAIHHRILYGSENRLWDLVSDAMGEEWRETQSSALGLDGEPFWKTCAATLRLYGLAADETRSLFDGRQERVVSRACELAALV
jgi:hypothetical protein